MKKITYAILLTAIITLVSGMQDNKLEGGLQHSKTETFNLQPATSKPQAEPMAVANNHVAPPLSGTIILIVAGVAGFFFVKKHQDLARKHQNFINKH